MRVQREKIQSMPKGNKSFQSEDGRKCCRGGTYKTVEVYKLEKSEEEVTVLVGVGSPQEAGGWLQDESF